MSRFNTASIVLNIAASLDVDGAWSGPALAHRSVDRIAPHEETFPSPIRLDIVAVAVATIILSSGVCIAAGNING